MKPATEALFSRKPQIGFSLIELMVVIAIVGIIAAIAYPSYSSHLIKGRRASAQAHLMDIAQRQQQYLLDARTYASSVPALSMTTPSDVAASYTIDVCLIATGACAAPGGTPPTFAAIAAPRAGTAQAGDGTLSIDQSGVKLPTNKW